jgi:hypothetical protein
MNNAMMGSGLALGNRKKRNLFLSENIGIEDEDGIPEEHIEF